MTAAIFSAMLATGVVYLWYGHRMRRLADERLASMIGSIDVEDTPDEPRRTIRTFPERYRMAAPASGIVAGGGLWLLTGTPIEVAAAVGLLFGVFAHLVEDFLAAQKAEAIEAQLAAAIYLMVGSLRAGASLLAAFESALEEVGPPLRPYFQEVAGRIRLGDDPRSAVSDLQRNVPLETFRLFATSLAVHWEVGGSLATTLSTVGQTVRDRIELSRRVRAQGVESQASVAVVLAIAYVLAFLMWRTNPDRLEAFVQTGIGTAIVAGVITLQAIGLVWMSRLNRSSF
ncbi:MAG TPA: type II secretion system F family protein [Vicinamibacterales bacterium]|nr:type II secretion system F family protein [Vicinamibacterales bacterium]